MNDFIARYQNEIAGVLSGFDRVLFRGTLRSLYALPVTRRHAARQDRFRQMPSSLHLRPRLSDLLKQRDIRLGVVGGHIDAAVTEDEACLIQGHAIPQHLRSCCVAKQMRTFGGSINVGAFESVLHHGGDPIS